MTNMEWIRSMTADELYEEIIGRECTRCVWKKAENCGYKYDRICRDGVIAWLNAEHKEDEDDEE